MNPLELANAIHAQELLVLALWDLFPTMPEVKKVATNEERHLYNLRCEAKKVTER